ncbi:hypothetical protein [Luteococcus japonicus]|uniref:hypothetical protein n=1 Tax=Luteococcus japonicus TaxID=33984 RepID=UPI001FE3446E|nr:hypothetical protein [Luteococcus japonicus]
MSSCPREWPFAESTPSPARCRRSIVVVIRPSTSTVTTALSSSTPSASWPIIRR